LFQSVLQLVAESSRLTAQIKDIKIIGKKERDNLADRFEAERARLRQALGDAREQAAKYALERDLAIAGHGGLTGKVGKLEKDLKKSEDERLMALSLAETSSAKQKILQNKLDKALAENGDLEKDNACLRMQLAALQKNLEDESVLRATANSKIRALTEDLEFLKKQHESVCMFRLDTSLCYPCLLFDVFKALKDLHHKRQVDMTTYAKQINDEFKSKLQDHLAEMRARFQAQLSSSKTALEESYKNKVSSTNPAVASVLTIAVLLLYCFPKQNYDLFQIYDALERAKAAHDDAARMRVRSHELENCGSSHDAVIDSLRREIAALKDDMDAARRSYQERLGEKELRIAELNREIQRIMDELHRLFDEKVQLDTELNTYRMLLELQESFLISFGAGGQSRNSISSHHVSFMSNSGSAQHGVKRARIEWDGNGDDLDFHRLGQKMQKHVDGPVGIEEIDPNGQWVRIRNNTDEEVSIAHWKLLVRAGGKEVTYQFNPRMKLDPHGHATVYSADSGEKHRSPTDVVMENQNWPMGDNTSVRPEDHEGNLRSSVILMFPYI
uniref:LTD domain-containing protein n=1 Tax=Haemonchus placei TaxID=6290 RepID=A0A0N4X9L9_HAEPC